MIKAIGLIGKKRGMTQVFTADGILLPVTVVEVQPMVVTQIKTVKTDGYSSVQVAGGDVLRPSRVNKPIAGHFGKAGVQARRVLHEFRVDEAAVADMKQGAEITISLLTEGQKVDVTSVSKGKGFQGGVKRHHFRTQDATHGNSVSHRVLGSTGQNQTPGRVFKGKKMAGRMGGLQVTIQSQDLVRVDADRNLLLIKGAIPGAPGSTVIVRPAVKAKKQEEKK